MSLCACQKVQTSLIEDDIQRCSNKRELVDLSQSHKRGKGFTAIEIWNCELWKPYNASNNVRKTYTRKLSLQTFTCNCAAIGRKIKANLFGSVQCEIEVSETVSANFADFPKIFKNTLVSKSDIDYLMKNYAVEEGKMSVLGKR